MNLDTMSIKDILALDMIKIWTHTNKHLHTMNVMFFLWLLASLSSSVTSKQVKTIPQFPPALLQNLKLSSLSQSLPSSILDSKNLVEPASVRNVTTQVGQTTYLHCIVDRNEDQTVGSQQRQVSWLRLRDFHLLTVALYTYTSDNRFQTSHNEYTSDWALQIKYPQQADEGLYECQISSDPPISHYVYLKVLVPKTKILGGENFYISAGSEVNLTCIISDCPEPPAYVFWYHDGRMINFDKTRGDISIQKAGGDTAISRLYIKDAEPHDSGNYTCSPSNAVPASVFVHVLKGEKHAAVQNDAASTSKSARFASSLHILFLLESILCFLCLRHSYSCTR